MSHISWIASGLFNLGWQEIVFCLLIAAVITVPGVIALALALLVPRQQRRKRK